ncbi:RNA-directed DNA polymerase, eukaryota [Tanacetum coccineum]
MVGFRPTTSHQKHTEDAEDVIEFQVKHDQMACLRKCWVGKARNIHVLRNVQTLLKQDGLGGCSIHYLGGMSILCEWSLHTVAKECLEKNKVNLGNWFSKLVMWNENLESHGWITWLEIEGIPALIWDSNTACKIGEKMGSVLEVDDMDSRHNISNLAPFDDDHWEVVKNHEFDSSSHVLPTYEEAAREASECTSNCNVHLNSNLNQDWENDIHIDVNLEAQQGDAAGLSGGTLLMWDSSIFARGEVLIGTHYVCVISKWNGVTEKLAVINIYGHQESRQKEELWLELDSLMNSKEAIWILFGDLKVVRTREERSGSNFVKRDARSFNNFIANKGLEDLAIGGRCFTRFNSTITKLISDHCPILMSVDEVNFGPQCFKIFNHWMDIEGFDKVIKSSWNNGVYRGSKDIVLKNKLKQLRMDIKKWSRDHEALVKRKKNDILNWLVE